MTPELARRYEFDCLPLEPIEPGTNVMVAGPPSEGGRRVVFEALADTDGGEGVLVVSTDLAASAAVKTVENAGAAFDPGRMCVLDCTSGATTADGPIRAVDSPADLTGVGVEFASLHESLLGRDRPAVRVGLSSVTTLLEAAAEFRPVYRFLHTLTSRIRTTDGFGICEIDPGAADQQAVVTVAQAFDARIDVRTGGTGPEIRVRDLDDQPDEWLRLEG